MIRSDVYNDKVLLSLLFSGLNSPSSLFGFSYYVRCPRSSILFMVFAGHALENPYLCCTGKPKTGYNILDMSRQGWADGKDLLLWVTINGLPYTAQMLLKFTLSTQLLVLGQPVVLCVVSYVVSKGKCM